jgi:LacI family transcriptional regulator
MARVRRPTVEDVGRAAGVAPSTVSRAFRHPDMVHAATRERVETAAAALGYQVNAAATALSIGHTGQLGLVLPDIENPFFPALVKEAELLARASGHALLLAHTGENPLAERQTCEVLARQTDGLIICSPRATDDELIALARKVTIVVVNRRIEDLPAVVLESATGMRQAMAHLAALGHRSVAYAGGPAVSWSNSERIKAFRVESDARGLEAVELGPYQPLLDSGLQAADEALARGVTATVAFNDLIAVGMLARFAVRGISVPRDMSVIGFDDIWISERWSPPLTTVAVPTRAAGRAATQLLLDLLAGANPSGQVVDLESALIIRATTAQPRQS